MTRKALVTGGNRGIGKAIAAGLVREGLDVVIGVRDLTSGQEAADEVGASVVEMDLADPESVARGLSEAGEITVLVNNAGILEDVGLLDDGDNFHRSMRIMVEAPYELMRGCLPVMAGAGYGRIVNVSSGWGSFAEGLGGGGAYGVAKAALNALTVRAAAQVPAGVKVNSMCPGWVRTRMGGPSATSSPEEGADTAIWLATLGEDGPSGGFFRRRKPIEW